MWCSIFFWWPARVMPRVGRSLVGKKWIKSGPVSPRSQAPTPALGPGLPSPTSPCLLQAELSHVTEGVEARLGEAVLVALQADGREPGLGGVQRGKVQGHGVQKGLGRSEGERQAGQCPLFTLGPFASVFFLVCLIPPWLSHALVPSSRPVAGAPAGVLCSLQSVWLADHLVKRSHQLVKVRSLGTILLPSVQHKQVQSRRTAWRRGQPELLLYRI